ncbi:hypothetical protein [Leptolyngbya phage Lbo-JY46]
MIADTPSADRATVTDMVLGYGFYNNAEKYPEEVKADWEHSSDVEINRMLNKQSKIPFIEKRDHIGRFKFCYFPKDFLTN